MSLVNINPRLSSPKNVKLHADDTDHMYKARGAPICALRGNVWDCDGNNMFYLLRYQTDANLCAHSSSLIHRSPSRSLSPYLPQYWLHLLNFAFLSDALDDR